MLHHHLLASENIRASAKVKVPCVRHASVDKKLIKSVRDSFSADPKGNDFASGYKDLTVEQQLKLSVRMTD